MTRMQERENAKWQYEAVSTNAGSSKNRSATQTVLTRTIYVANVILISNEE